MEPYSRLWNHLNPSPVVLNTRFRRSLESTYARSVVAGYVVSHAYQQDWEALRFSQGWVALIGVRPAWRGRKLAPALLAGVLRAYADDGMDAAGLDVDTGNATGALTLYEGMGFHVKQTYIMCALENAEQP
jgi:ribosomal protein S18 acetylase RimI-like enzyme